MKKIFQIVLIVLLSITSGLVMAQSVQPGVFRIKVSPDLANQIDHQLKNKSADKFFNDALLQKYSEKYSLQSVKRVFNEGTKFEARHKQFGLHLWYEIRVSSKAPVAQMVFDFGSHKQVEISEPVYVKQHVGKRLNKTKNVKTELTQKANDPELINQWHYFNNGSHNTTVQGADVWVQNAWTLETGDSNVIVAVLDGGVDVDHVDIINNMWRNTQEIPGNGVDDDNNGYIDDVHGWNFVYDTSNIVADDHGTHVAGIVAATSNNGVGVAGIAGGSGNGDGVRIMSCEIFEDKYQSYDIASAFVYAADNGAVIAQNSWSYTSPDVIEQALLDGIDYFIATAGFDINGQPVGPMQGGIVFFASGNEGQTGNWWPSCYDKVTAVGSTDGDDLRSVFSNYGTWVDISAPGGKPGVFSTIANNSYGAMEGTSMACPHVTGVAALLLSQNLNNITPLEIRERLLSSADPIDDINPGFEAKIGSGRLNAYRALLGNTTDDFTPNQIDDLSLNSASNISLGFAWTAPGRGSENTGTVDYYDVRVSEKEISEENFFDAAKVEFRHAQPQGYTENIEVTGILPGTTYYLAVKAIDYMGNVSGISNLASGTTHQAPSMLVSNTYTDTVNLNSQEFAYSLPIKNIGQQKLGYRLKVEYDFGQLNNFIQPERYTDSIEVDETKSIDLNYDFSMAEDGIYNAYLILETNDPFRPKFTINLNILVHGHSAEIVSSESSLDFRNVYLGNFVEKTLKVANSDDARGFLQVSTTTISAGNVTVSSSLPLFVAPGETGEIVFKYSPDKVQTLNDSVILHTNNTALSDIVIPVSGFGIEPPAISVLQDKISAVLTSTDTESFNLTISNIGQDSLKTRFMVENLSDVNQTAVAAEIELSTIFEENFEGNGIPVGWDMDTKGFGWAFGNNLGSKVFDIPDHTKYAVVNDDLYGEANNAQFDYLFMPELSLLNADSAQLVFDSYFTGEHGMKAHVKLSTDGGENWLTIYSLNGSTGWENIIVDLTAYIENDVLIAFHANDQGLHATGWAIDNVKIKTNVNWLDVSIANGENAITAGEQSTFQVELNAGDLAEGSYKANLWVLSNDPVMPRVAIPVEMEVVYKNNVLLSKILINDIELETFNSNQFIYEVTVESDEVPMVTAVAQNSAAAISIEQAVNVSGELNERKATIHVSSAESDYTQEYIVMFAKAVNVSSSSYEFMAYPNPANNKFTINISNYVNTRFELLDLSGNVLKAQHLNMNSSEVDITELSGGIYLIRIIQNNKPVSTQKLIKL